MAPGALSRNMIFAAGQVLAQILVLFFLYRYLINTIGIEQLGVWAIILATASAARVSELGLSGSVTKFVASYRAAGNEEHARDALQTAAVSLGILLAVILISAYPIVLWALPNILPAESTRAGSAVLPYAFLSLWFASVGGVWLAGLDGCLRSDLRAAVMVFSTLIYVIAAVVGVRRYGLTGLAAAQVIQSVLLAVFGWLLLRRVTKTSSFFPLKWSRARFRDMLSYGVNFQINSIVMLLFEPTTKILFGRYGELAAAGYFELAQRLVTRIRGLIVETNRVIVPVLAGMRQDGSEAQNLYRKNARYLCFLLTPLFGVLLAVLPGISELWIGSYQTVFVVIAVCLSVAWYLNAMTAPAYFAYLGSGRLRWLTISHFIMGSLNLVVGLLLGHIFGWRGIVAAFAGSLVIGSLIPVAMYHRERRLSLAKILSRHDYSLAAICIAVAATALVAYAFMHDRGTAAWMHRVLVFGGATTIIAAATLLHPLARDLVATGRTRLRRVLVPR